ncbi:MAG: glycoside hydrolase family 57 protein [Sulfuricellaceae bacterium]|nr:glycoside hydrolase family 57 protein [Sulfuricellaceae bacterium]
MSKQKKLKLVLCWHMHQPDYRHHVSGEFALPWTYLHAIKDYTDMAYHLEQAPQAHAVVNFVPVLLDQLEDYTEQFASRSLRDPLLRLLAAKDLEHVTPEQRKLILDSCFRCNHSKMVEPYPAYKRLHDLYKIHEAHGADHYQYLSGQYLADLLVWYHLSWTGESVRRENEQVVAMMSKGAMFTLKDRQNLVELIGKLISNIIPRYRKLAQSGQVELSSTPYYHPIAPLMLDFSSAQESAPGMEMPLSPQYPGGASRIAFHIAEAVTKHEKCFGMKPVGMWPAEGGVSQASALLMAKQGVQWIATGQAVLANSLRHAQRDAVLDNPLNYLYRPYRISHEGDQVACFFRDDGLSDMIGFEYANWFGLDAVHNFVAKLENIWRHGSSENPVVSIILDGENAWEYYPYNGFYFLSELYQILENHPHIETTTFSEYIAHCQEEAMSAHPELHACADSRDLSHLVAGSWVYGNFSTWIGCPEKNRAWDLLCQAKQTYDLVMGSGRLNPEQRIKAERQLAACEGSDWFWWFGDYNPGDSVRSFDNLYRENLADLYRHLLLVPPVELDVPISHGGGHAEVGGAMRRAS